MKISLNWLKDYVEIPNSPEELSEILTSLGLEVEGMQTIHSVEGGLEGVVVGEVTSCEKHPNADRLSLTEVNVGGEELLQIVCGAPNVATGQKVAVALIGSTLYPQSGDPFKIRKGKIRGTVSQGMICAEDELGLGTDHSGIMVLDQDAIPGQPAAQYVGVETDVVYEIGLTPNRSDATSHLGVARDLAAYYSYHQGTAVRVTLPDLSNFSPAPDGESIHVDVLDTTGCPRYSGISLRDIQIKDSPRWMQFRLKAVDVRPINNIVDITNYVLHEYGQPLHAFDQDKITGKKIRVERLQDGSKFTTLDEQERTLTQHDLMICDGESNGMCIAGVFGGVGSGVVDTTDQIFLEAAHFNANSVRKTSVYHDLRTDAARCFEKGSDPSITVEAIKRASILMQEFANAKISSDLIDVYPEPIKPHRVSVQFAKVNSLIGNDLPREKVKEILEALSIGIVDEGEDSLTVEIPTDKNDVTRDADVIEEILRIYGFNNVVLDDRINTAVQPQERPDKNTIRNLMSEQLKARGLNEMMGLSLVNSSYYDKVLHKYGDQLVKIHNTSNVNLDAMRPEMVISMLLSVAHNQNRQQSDLNLFEFGNTYNRIDDNYHEKEVLAIMLSGSKEIDSWRNDTTKKDFFDLKRLVWELFSQLGLEIRTEENTEDERFKYGLDSFLGKEMVATYGQIDSKVLTVAEVKGPIYYAEIDVALAVKAQVERSIEFSQVSRFPSSRRDLAFVVDKQMKYSDLVELVERTAGPLLKSVHLFDIYEDEDQLGKDKKSYALSLLFVKHDKSLKDKEIDKIIQRVVSKTEEDLGAKLR